MDALGSAVGMQKLLQIMRTVMLSMIGTIPSRYPCYSVLEEKMSENFISYRCDEVEFDRSLLTDHSRRL